jgi:hypothetical protein
MGNAELWAAPHRFLSYSSSATLREIEGTVGVLCSDEILSPTMLCHSGINIKCFAQWILQCGPVHVFCARCYVLQTQRAARRDVADVAII